MADEPRRPAPVVPRIESTDGGAFSPPVGVAPEPFYDPPEGAPRLPHPLEFAERYSVDIELLKRLSFQEYSTLVALATRARSALRLEIVPASALVELLNAVVVETETFKAKRERWDARAAAAE